MHLFPITAVTVAASVATTISICNEEEIFKYDETAESILVGVECALLRPIQKEQEIFKWDQT